jgi:ubiquinone/menaquinone biosynthesis C-methylase UbiE
MARALVQQKFGAAAADYAASAVHAEGPSLARAVTLVSPQSGWRVLDVATGAGHMAAAFAPHVAKVIASDITDEMLAEAAKLAAAKGLANVETARAEAGALPFADASFDLVTCRLAAHHFPDPGAFVREVHRVLRPGGTFALVDNVSPDAEIDPQADEAALRELAAVYNAFEKLRDPSHGRALGLAEWRGLMQDAGFEVAHAERMDQEIGFVAWTTRMRCDAGTVARLEAMLDAVPLRTFLRPHDGEAGPAFVLQEAIIVARRGGP